MSTYLVESHWPGVTESKLELAVERLAQATQDVNHEGTPARYLGSILIVSDEVVFSLFEGESSAAIQEANSRAAVQVERIGEATCRGLISMSIGEAK